MDKESTRILLVEDDPEDALLVREMLNDAQDFPFEMENADSLSTALERLDKATPDVVLSDLGLPDSRGLDTFTRIQAQAPETPILVLTGSFDNVESAIEAVKKGAQDYLLKDKVNGEMLVRSIRYAIERKRLVEIIRKMALHDPLTNLPNRILLNDRLAVALAHAHRNKEMLAVMFLDLDGFKAVNDVHGHAVGDQLLKGVGERLTDCVREDDTVARMGGDEFTLLLPGIKEAEDAAGVAHKILTNVKQPLALKDIKLSITTSIGIALYPNHAADPDTLLKNADTAMYRAKNQGKDNYQFYTPA